MRKGAQILDRFKKKLDFVFFPLGLSNFWVGAWFSFDEGQFIDEPESDVILLNQRDYHRSYLSRGRIIRGTAV